MKRRNLAMIGVGVAGIPVLREILTRLSSHVDITIYSFIPVNKSEVPSTIRIKCLPRFHVRLQYLVLGLWFCIDHLRKPYHTIHAQSAFPGGVLARRLHKITSIPWMVTLIGGEVESMPEIPFGDLINPRLRTITRKVCAEANVLTVMSHFQATSVKQNLFLDQEIVVLPYAPVAGILDPEKEITVPVKLLHIAYHHPVKNHDMLLEVAEKLVDKISFTVTIVGANYGEAFLQQITDRNLGAYIHLVGAQSYSSIEKYLRDSHILIHTSWYEGLPTVAFEAMANGVAVCGTAVGIMADFSGSHCLTVAPGQSAELADMIVSLANNPSLYQQLRTTAYAWSSQHDVDYYVKTMMELYQKMDRTTVTPG